MPSPVHSQAAPLAFTRLELVVTLCMSTILGLVTAPILVGNRAGAQSAASLSNMERLGVAQLAYAADHSDTFVNPFGSLVVNWYYVVASPPTANPSYWDFGTFSPNHPTMMFSAHWACLLMDYADPGQRFSQVQIAPADETAGRRLKQLAQIVAGQPHSNYVVDGSYWMSPTLWTLPRLYHSAFRSSMTLSTNIIRRNRLDEVLTPAEKVLIWERFDFSKTSRLAPNVRYAEGFPTWNNPIAEPRTFTADGSVAKVNITQLNLLIGQESPDNGGGRPHQPAGNWDVPTTTLTAYDLNGDGLENGQNGTLSNRAFFWATHNGVHGSDFKR